MNDKSRWFIVIGMIMTASFFAVAQPAQANNTNITAQMEALFPIPKGGRGGGVASHGRSHMKLIDAGPDGTMIHLAGDKAPVQGAWWFPRHRFMSIKHAMAGDSQGRIVLKIEAASPVQTTVSVQWRNEHQKPTGQPVTSSPLLFGPGQMTKVVLMIPKPDHQIQKLGGLIFKFARAGDYQIRYVALARESKVALDPIKSVVPQKADNITLTGRATAGVDTVTVRFMPQSSNNGARLVEKQAAVHGGRFSLLLVPGRDLPAGLSYTVTVEPTGRANEISPPQRLFVYPSITGKQAPRVTRQRAYLMCQGQHFGFLGVNYTRFQQGLSRQANYQDIAHDIMQMKRWGIRAVRLPLNIGLIEPAPGVFPDSPKYVDILKAHHLDPRFMDQVNYFVHLAGQEGIYTIIDWHGFPTNPYRWAMGGLPRDKKAGKPGQAIAYLAPTQTKAVPFDLSNPKHLAALLSVDRWTARHFRGNSNILGIEIPFNEPHNKFMSIEANWRRMTNLCAQAVEQGDPKRLTFTLGPSYDHNNLLQSVTWLPCDRASGAAPHFYLANGPVPLRPDAKKFSRYPWLARNAQATFGWGFSSMMMPFSAVNYPIYNGEGGKHGYAELLPDYKPTQAASLMIEAQLVQAYAAGMSGYLEWTLWGNPKVFQPFVGIYREQFQRFAPVFDSGPVNRQAAQVAFIQSPAAAPNRNGYNYSCVPFAKLALDLHIEPVAYLTGAQLRYQALAELSVGLEQVTSAAESLHYKALVVDQRHLDPRTLAMIRNLHIPVLYTKNAAALSDTELASFLRRAGVAVDTKTPRQIQLIQGPAYLIAYRRLAGADHPVMIYPHLHRKGRVTLTDETGRPVFSGTVDQLAAGGFEVNLPLWRSAIFHITQP